MIDIVLEAEKQEIVSRQFAISNGLRHYFTGVPCKWGHVAKRFVSSNSCLECSRERERGLPDHYRRDLLRKRMGTTVHTHCAGCGVELYRVGYERADAKYCSRNCGSRKRNATYREKNPESVKKQRFLQNCNYTQRIFYRIKSRAKEAGIAFNLDLHDIIVPETCPVLGISIDPFPKEGRKNRPDSPSVDRIDPSKGYVKGNVRVISNRANLLKSNAEVWELELVLRDLKELRCG